jgi:hypothetical protein
MSRKPLIEVSASRGVFELRFGSAGSRAEADGMPFDRTRRLSPDDLRHGLILTVGRRFVGTGRTKRGFLPEAPFPNAK